VESADGQHTAPGDCSLPASQFQRVAVEPGRNATKRTPVSSP